MRNLASRRPRWCGFERNNNQNRAKIKGILAITAWQDFFPVQFQAGFTKYITILDYTHQFSALYPWLGDSARNSMEFRNYSDSRPFELWNFHQNFIFQS
jgi:hypothetical protein